ncbi:MAG: hypothetical protein EG825_15205 [Rhodocyclaceae bacterium]|nr:hypothetical protein [Rhodocyclaceae bacterium]
MLATYPEGFWEQDGEDGKVSWWKWDPEKRLWFIRYGNIKGTVLEKHIVVDASRISPMFAKTDKSI